MQTHTIRAGEILPGGGVVAYGCAVVVYPDQDAETMHEVREKALQLRAGHLYRLRRRRALLTQIAPGGHNEGLDGKPE